MVVVWEMNKSQEAKKQKLVKIKYKIKAIYEKSKKQMFLEEEKTNLIRSEGITRKILSREEVAWRLKRKAIGIEKGDENTICF